MTYTWNEEASSLWNQSKEDIKKTKQLFSNVIKFINSNPDINETQLTPDMKKHFKHLIRLWRHNDDANIDYYFNMKEHHSHINGLIANETLTTLWDNYLSSGLDLRNKLSRFNHMCHQ
jgi:hypothetical protein